MDQLRISLLSHGGLISGLVTRHVTCMYQ